MPSPRLLAVTALVVLGGLAGVISAGGDGESETPPSAQQPPAKVSGGLVSNPVLDISAENQQAGDDSWRIGPARDQAKGLAAYAGTDSAEPGAQVPLYLRGQGTVEARAFRLGWYGGDGARLVWDGTFPAQPQTGPPGDWVSGATLDTSGWPEGSYLVRLDLGKASRFVPLTVTSKQTSGRVVVLTSPMTAAATTSKGSAAQGREVRLDKPLASSAGPAAAAGVIAQIENTGTDVVYLTDADLAAAPELLDSARAVLVAGESRYWTAKMRKAVQASGADLAFFGANTAGTTATFDSASRSFTVRASGNTKLSGAAATCAANGSTGLTVSDAAWWGFEGSQVSEGEVLKGLVSGRLDQAAAGAQTIASTTLLCGDTQATSYLDAEPAVFNAGTEAWGCTVSGFCLDGQGRRVRADARAQEVAAAVTRNITLRFAASR
ncbi:N,N-dimethylformamidase beta subunit family domain-containing protein [Kineosporia babensis]|uniref:N,N-dimethylformamidase beta subunit-like C-terminal domain-containing protein n=1 Tax=Kineosporia babensis TaxID=499548 RepID=A0A9X1NEW9_9ACTN|nr:N,N-dimethylformamidase beta subunit family domain-containing protein [Kineosporia babensis]MCD5312555.1 hypothetical protein [Kineosporia babensis]